MLSRCEGGCGDSVMHGRVWPNAEGGCGLTQSKGGCGLTQSEGGCGLTQSEGGCGLRPGQYLWVSGVYM